ncbi:hypothetical protein BDR05DRAFT_891241, partial [Suillus weaverae]
AKYALATANKLIDMYGANGVTRYNIGCSVSKTMAASSVADKVKKVNHHFFINAFHGHAHNHHCQLHYHTLYQKGLGIEDLKTCECVFAGSNAVALLIWHASHFHWLQFINLQFDQWNLDHYQELSQFLYNNYKQVVHITNNLMPVIQELKQQLDLSDAVFKQWNIKELQYLEALAAEPEYDPEKITYVEPCSHWPRLSRCLISAHNKLIFKMNAVLDLEHQLGLMEHWTSHDPKYQEALKYLNNN